MRQVPLLAVLFLTATSAAFAAVIVEHVGANNPATEGWTLYDESHGGNIYGPAFNDLGSVDAWRLDTLTNGAEGDLTYDRTLSDQEVNDALTNGWELTANVRVIQAEAYCLVLRFSTGSRLYDMYLSAGSPVADPVITLHSDDGRSETILGGAGLYHLIRLSDRNADGLTDVFIDGTLAVPDYGGGLSNYRKILQFGDYKKDSATNGYAMYAQVTFEILPEPSSAALLLLAAGVFSLRRRRQKA